MSPRRMGLLGPVALAMLACEAKIEGPSPTFTAPEQAASPVLPGYVCREQLTTEVALHGAAFAPAPIDVPNAPRTALPTVTLTGALALDGASVEAPVPITYGGELEQANASKLTWQGQQQMTLTVDQALVVDATGEPGLLPAAVYDVTLTNPTGEVAQAPAHLAALDRPSVADFQPRLTCLAQGDRALRFDGASFAVIDGQPATVAIGEAPAFGVGAFDGCAPVPHAVIPGELCTGADVPLAQDALPVGYHAVSVGNPDPAPCRTEEDLMLRVVPPPTLTEAEPAMACVAEGEREIILRGQDLLAVDGTLPTVVMTDAAGAPVTLEVRELLGTCQDLETQGLTVRTCTEARVVLPVAVDAPEPYLPTFTLTNPGPAGCEAVLPEAFVLVPEPTLSEAVPPAICTAEGDRDVELVGTGFIEVDGTPPTVQFGDLDLAVVGFAECDALPVPRSTVRRCARMTVRVPQGLPMVDDGGFLQPGVTVTNPQPAGCGSESPDLLTVLPAPRIDAAEPPLVCDAQGDRQVIVRGAGFLQYGDEQPAITFAGEAVTITSMDDCQPVPVPLGNLQTCAAVTVNLAQGTFAFEADADSLVATVRVVNPDPVGCEATDAGALVAVPAPRIDALEPPLICAGGPVAFTVRGDHFVTVDGAPPTVTLDGVPLAAEAIAPADCGDVAVEGHAVTSCNALVLTVDPATLDGGDAVVAVTNPDPAGCSADLAQQPVAVVAPPTVAAVAPDFLCTDDGARAVMITGSDFMAIGDLQPTVAFGDAVAQVTALEDCAERTVGALTWQMCSTLRVSVAQGALAPGAPPVRVTNPAPAGCSSETPDLLAVPPTLSLVEVAPASVCIEAGDRELTIQGTGFLEIDGVGPTLTLAGQPFAIASLGGCEALPQRAGARACTAITVTLPQGSVPQGAVEVAVANPGQGQCAAASAEIFYVVPVPVIEAIEPDVVCERAQDAFDIVGRDFTPVSTVRLGDRAAPVEFIDDTRLRVTVEDAVDPGTYPVTVTNADGCEASVDAAVQVAPRPVVFFVDPPVDYNGITLQATVFTSRLEAPPAEVRFEGPQGEAEVLAGTPRAGRPNQIRVTLPQGLTPGLWSVQVTSELGCVGRLEDGLTVTDDLSVAAVTVQPPFAAPDAPTAVVIDRVDGPDAGFQATPRAYLTPSVPVEGAPASPLRAVVFVDADRLTAVVPPDLAPGAYDLVIVNPDATVGVTREAVTVVPDEPPVVREVTPASLDGNAPQAATLAGAGFGDGPVSVDLRCRTPDGGEGQAVGVVAAATLTPTEVDVTLPSDQFPAGSVCVVRLTRADGAYFDYSALSIKTPAQNLNPWQEASPMGTARRALALEAARPTEASRFLYAIGGDAGAPANALASVEAAQVDLFGNIGDWRDERAALPAPRTRAGSARIGDFLYLVGGSDGTAAVDTVWRAQVLDPLAGPEVVDLALFLDEEAPTGLGAGIWHYRVSAVFPGDDPNNPGGESLPGEVMVLQLPAADGLHLQLTWAPVDGASGYRVYRTAAAGDGPDTVGLVAQVAGVTWLDTGVESDPATTPLPPGALGLWHAVEPLDGPRAGAAVVAAAAPDGSGDTFLYAFGGEGAGGPLDTWAWTRITRVGDTDVVAPWQQAASRLAQPRADLHAWTATRADLTVIAEGATWIWLGSGRGPNGLVNVAEAGLVGADGDLGALQPVSATGAAAGYGAGSANGFLFMLGGQNGQPSSSGISGEICRPGLGGCQNQGPP
ncbi:MAG: IPT/TIG domain-containing protein, partial [Myxococcales bacterium]|nr:IPT/TIG domain-containing protein [Myxococcales bacterium]